MLDNDERAFCEASAHALDPFSEGIRAILDTYPGTAAPEDMAAVAEHIGASEMVIGHQVDNQLMAA